MVHLTRLWPQHWCCNRAVSLRLSILILLPRQFSPSADSHKEVLKQARLSKKNDLWEFSMFSNESLVWVHDFLIWAVYTDRGSHSFKAQPTWQNSQQLPKRLNECCHFSIFSDLFNIKISKTVKRKANGGIFSRQIIHQWACLPGKISVQFKIKPSAFSLPEVQVCF